jgi:hypothetical protein
VDGELHPDGEIDSGKLQDAILQLCLAFESVEGALMMIRDPEDSEKY